MKHAFCALAGIGALLAACAPPDLQRGKASLEAGDIAAADDVQLDLPETGVCSTQFDEASSACCTTGDAPAIAVAASGESACAAPSCGGAPKARADACCGTDEKIKDAGGAGCGSAASKAATAKAAATKGSGCCG